MINNRKIFYLSLAVIFVLAGTKLWLSGNMLVNGLLIIVYIINIISIFRFRFTDKIFKATRLVLLLALVSMAAFSAMAYFLGEETVFTSSLKNASILISFAHFILILYIIIKLRVNKSANG